MKPTNSGEATPSNDKSRNVTGGYNTLTGFFPIIHGIMFILGWFTVPVEVLFRRNFGQRWLTLINFYAGLIVIGGFAAMQSVAGAMGKGLSNSGYGYSNVQNPPEPSIAHRLMENSMWLFLLAYLLIGSYHFFRMWWRNRTNTSLHSFDDGTSLFEPIAVYPMRLFNLIAIPVLRLYMLLLPKQEKERNLSVPPLMEDVTAFTNTIFEPFLLILLAFLFRNASATFIWLLISAPALGIYANWKETAKLNKALDFRDTVIEAGAMHGHMNSLGDGGSAERLIFQQAAETIKENPKVVPFMNKQYPDLMSIIDEMNHENIHLADGSPMVS